MRRFCRPTRAWANVTIENLSYEDILERYDRPHTFFYLDPPYCGYKVYRLNFVHADFEKMAKALARLRGKFLMSINNCPPIRAIFKAFQIRAVTLKYSASHPRSGNRKASRQELLISNY